MQRKNEIVQLETKRLVLRNWNESDLNDFIEIFSSKETRVPHGLSKIDTESKAMYFIEDFKIKRNNYAVVLKSESKVIGTIGLNEDFLFNENTRNLGFSINKKYWNMGYLSESLDAILKNAYKFTDFVSITHSKGNDVSKHIAEKYNFIQKSNVDVERGNKTNSIVEAYYVLDVRK